MILETKKTNAKKLKTLKKSTIALTAVVLLTAWTPQKAEAQEVCSSIQECEQLTESLKEEMLELRKKLRKKIATKEDKKRYKKISKELIAAQKKKNAELEKIIAIQEKIKSSYKRANEHLLEIKNTLKRKSGDK